MKTIKQISIFLENKSGKLTEALDCLSKENINILALNISDTAEYGILRMIVTDAELAAKSLSEHTFSVNINNVIALEIPDEVGSLSKTIKFFSLENLSVDYVYLFNCGDKTILVMRTVDNDKAFDIIAKNNLNLVSEQEILSKSCLE